MTKYKSTPCSLSGTPNTAILGLTKVSTMYIYYLCAFFRLPTSLCVPVYLTVDTTKDGSLIRELNSKSKPAFNSCVFAPATLTSRGCTAVDCTVYGRGNGRQLHCLRFLLSCRQNDGLYTQKSTAAGS